MIDKKNKIKILFFCKKKLPIYRKLYSFFSRINRTIFKPESNPD